MSGSSLLTSIAPHRFVSSFPIGFKNGVKTSDRAAIDLTGYTVYLDTLNTYEVNSNLTSVTPENYQTIIAIK